MPLRLRKLYRLAGWITGVGCLLLGGMLFTANLDAYQRDRAGARDLQRFHLALLAANTVSAERGPANSLMGADPAAMPQLAAALAAARQRTDESLAALEVALRGGLNLVAPEQLILARSQLKRGRDAVDGVSSLSLENRDGAQVRTAIETMFAAADRAASLRDELGRTIVRNHPQIGTEVILSTICSSMREYAGRMHVGGEECIVRRTKQPPAMLIGQKGRRCVPRTDRPPAPRPCARCRSGTCPAHRWWWTCRRRAIR